MRILREAFENGRFASEHAEQKSRRTISKAGYRSADSIFWSEYDSHYTPLLAMNDAGEKDLDGALLYTKLGKGTYIVTRHRISSGNCQRACRESYRLFVNLLAASRSHWARLYLLGLCTSVRTVPLSVTSLSAADIA